MVGEGDGVDEVGTCGAAGWTGVVVALEESLPLSLVDVDGEGVRGGWKDAVLR